MGVVRKKTVDITYVYGHTITLRKNMMGFKEWEYVCKQFDIYDYAPEDVYSITIEGGDKMGRQKVSFTVRKGA